MKIAYEKAIKCFLDNDNITGVAVGWKFKNNQWINEKCLSFRVKEKKQNPNKEERIPDTFHDFKTDVIEGIHKPLTQVSRLDPLKGGTSIGQEGSASYGTLGLVVFDQQRNPYILTNYHVAVPAGETPGYVIQPSKTDEGVDVVDRIGSVSDYNIDEYGDFAIVNIDPGHRSFSTVLLSGDNILSVKEAEIGDLVKKIGRSTDTTYGVVSAVGTFAIDYSAWGLGTITMQGFEFIPLVDPNEVISEEGDSGACVYIESEGAALGILTASFSSPSITFACSMVQACRIFDLRIIEERSLVKVIDVDGNDQISNYISLGWTSEQKNVSVTVIFGESYGNLFLHVDSDFVGLLQAKLSTGSEYMPVGVYCDYPTCFLGDVQKNSPVTIDFRFDSDQVTDVGEQNIVVNFGYDCLDMIRNSGLDDFFWIGDLL